MLDIKSPDTTTTRIARRTRGQSHGPNTRLMSPSDFGRLLKTLRVSRPDRQSGKTVLWFRAPSAFRHLNPDLRCRGQRPLRRYERSDGTVARRRYRMDAGRRRSLAWRWRWRTGTDARLPALGRLAARLRAGTIRERLLGTRGYSPSRASARPPR